MHFTHTHTQTSLLYLAILHVAQPNGHCVCGKREAYGGMPISSYNEEAKGWHQQLLNEVCVLVYGVKECERCARATLDSL